MELLRGFKENVNRRRILRVNTLDTDLKRYMTTFDLTSLGLSHNMGIGIFILVGSVANTLAGPAVTLSILIAAICALLSALNYAELSSRVPRSGSAYVYVYMVAGEIWAFVIGWAMILEYMAATTSVASTFSMILDTTFNGFMKNITVDLLLRGHEWQSPYFVHYPNIIAGMFICLYTLVLLCGISSFSKFINVMIYFLMAVLIVFIGYSLQYIDVSNWSNYGGFMPTGMLGVIAGAAKLFFLFGSFEVICTSSEECKDPMKSIPIALVLCIVVYAIFAIASGMCLTLIVPWTEINHFSPIPEAFMQYGDVFPTYLITIGILFGITGCGLTSMYGVTRLTYAMAVDKLLFSFLASVSRNQVPIASTIVSFVVTFFVALLIPFDSLVDLLNIGSITSYLVVAALVVILRYRPVQENSMFFKIDKGETASEKENEPVIIGGTLKEKFKYLHFLESQIPGRVVVICLAIFIICSWCFLLIFFKYSTLINKGLTLILMSVLSIISIVSVGIILLHHKNNDDPPIKVPWVPFAPFISILCNICLLVNIPAESWSKFLVWLLAGLIIYFCYGYHHSNAVVDTNAAIPKQDSSPLLNDSEEISNFGTTEMVDLRPQEKN
ncbi:uncharacterized amino acid permease YhdG-like isoform X2 [Anneissia japonica]|uniref:uncharacterized amino acid permease YhdG-like isoform X2 n=1 Tax=Anneissia japonica TaxID=1529436 RepID=UPI00142596FF|nr:uncharacterized amino acid permease YhdG-like isoform X2 [Anneissia japonica]